MINTNVVNVDCNCGWCIAGAVQDGFALVAAKLADGSIEPKDGTAWISFATGCTLHFGPDRCQCQCY